MLRPDEKQTAIKQKIRGTLGPLLSLCMVTYIPVNGFPRVQSEAQPCQRRRADPRGLRKNFLQGGNIYFAKNDKPPDRHFIGFFSVRSL